MTSQHSGGQTTVDIVSSMCDHLAHWHVPHTHASLMPLGWHGMLVGFLAKLLAGLRQLLAAWRAGLVMSQLSVHFVPHVLIRRQMGGHREPSHHQHILMSEKIHDETCNMWSSIVLLKGHVPSLTMDEGQHVQSNNLLQVVVCIQIAINNDQGCPAMGWGATPHHHTPTAKRTSWSNACILVALAHPAVHHNPTIWMIQTKSRFIWEQYSFPFLSDHGSYRFWWIKTKDFSRTVLGPNIRL